MTFEQAKCMMSRGKCKLAHETYLISVDEDTYGVRYHNTIVVKIHKDGSYTLNSGGYDTQTTYRRMREYSPARFARQKRGELYVNGTLFFDGVRI